MKVLGCLIYAYIPTSLLLTFIGTVILGGTAGGGSGYAVGFVLSFIPSFIGVGIVFGAIGLLAVIIEAVAKSTISHD